MVESNDESSNDATIAPVKEEQKKKTDKSSRISRQKTATKKIKAISSVYRPVNINIPHIINNYSNQQAQL